MDSSNKSNNLGCTSFSAADAAHHLRADLRQNDFRQASLDADDGFQPLEQMLKRAQALCNLVADAPNRFI
jgi:hypothetical protein